MLKSINRIVQFLSNQRIIPINIVVFACSTLFISCGTSKLDINTFPSTKHHFTGLLVIDPATKDTLVNQNANKYFTPASNTKIFTLYTALKLLPEKLPALKYIRSNDTLYIEGTGDPTLLHPDFKEQNTFDFVQKHKNIALFSGNYLGNRYGPGWAWEDYDTYFSPETGSFPLYGNVILVTQTDSLAIVPNYFRENVSLGKKNKFRDERTNTFHIPYSTDTLRIPYITSDELSITLLEKETGSRISAAQQMPKGTKEILWGITADELYKKMMLKSDNFLAEQMMLMVSSQLSDTLSFTTAKKHILDKYLTNLKHEPRWVDGSGLSRYNLFTPNSMVHVLHTLYNEFPRERLFYLFPRWNESGTFEYSKANNDSYIIAKSGALGNTYNLSGFLITKSKKVLIFSFMNNHFRIPSKDIRIFIKETLQKLHQDY